MNDDTAITIDHVSKSFKLPHEKQSSLKGLLTSVGKRKKSFEIQQALKEVSFEIKKGEFFGIVGRNGSGKSTLLKLLAGIYAPTKGAVHVNGSLTPFIELGVGFNPELTGRENVFLNGALLGFNRKEVKAMYKSIVEFAELKKFMDQKLKNYSSGMQVRLAFSIAIQAESDILLLDEVLAVGDTAFQQKCYDVFDNMKAKKQTIVFVTHDMAAIKKYCTRAALIDNGDLVTIDTPRDIARKYEELNQKDIDRETTKRNMKNIVNSKLEMTITDSAGKKRTSFEHDEELVVKLHWPKGMPVENAGVAIHLRNGQYIFGANTIYDKIDITNNALEYKVRLNLGPGRYFVAAGLFGKDDEDVLEFVGDGPTFSIMPPKNAKWEGLSPLTHTWESQK